MITALRTIAPPALPVVTPALAQQHARIDSTYDTDYVSWLIETATDLAQQYLNRALITQTLQWSIAHDRSRLQGMLGGTYGTAYSTMFPGNLGRQHSLELPRAPLQAVTSIVRGDPLEGDVTYAPTMYGVSTTTDPGRVQIYGNHYPDWSIHSLAITYVAGYGDTSDTIPTPIRHAVLMMVANLYEHRGDEDGGEMPTVVERLLDPYRLDVFC